MQFLIAQWLHWLQLFFSRKAVADRLQYMCDRGLSNREDCYSKPFGNFVNKSLMFYHKIISAIFPVQLD